MGKEQDVGAAGRKTLSTTGNRIKKGGNSAEKMRL